MRQIVIRDCTCTSCFPNCAADYIREFEGKGFAIFNIGIAIDFDGDIFAGFTWSKLSGASNNIRWSEIEGACGGEVVSASNRRTIGRSIIYFDNIVTGIIE